MISHFRSLLISRFSYSKTDSIVRIKAIKVIAMIPPSHYEVVSLSMFLAMGVWPRSQIFNKKKWGRGGKYQLLALSSRISNFYVYPLGYTFFWKMSTLNFPCVDAADRKADYVFLLKSVTSRTSQYAAPYLIESFLELDFIANSNSKLIKGLSKYWAVKWSFTTTKANSLVEHTAPLRVLSFGATF